VTRAEAERIKELQRENRQLRRANEILKAASAFFAGQLDPRPPKSYGVHRRAPWPARGRADLPHAAGPPSTCWAHNKRRREPAARTLSDKRLLVATRHVHEQSRALYSISRASRETTPTCRSSRGSLCPKGDARSRPRGDVGVTASGGESGHAATIGAAAKDGISAGRDRSIERGVSSQPAPTSKHSMRTFGEQEVRGDARAAPRFHLLTGITSVAPCDRGRRRAATTAPANSCCFALW
jgi:hypothetical protein